LDQQAEDRPGPGHQCQTAQLKCTGAEGDRLHFRTHHGGKIVVVMPVSPGPGATVHSPFVVSGTFDFKGDLPQLSLRSDTGQGTFGPTMQVIPPPGGMDWAFQFNVKKDDYTLTDLEGSKTYVTDPIHVK
jgi:hypothetical protein